MCIIFLSKEKRPSDEILVRADERNSDGIGLAWREEIKGKRVVRWEKGLDIKALLELLHKNQPPFPFVMHFRSATVGGADPRLCHPFVVSPKAPLDLRGSADSVLFHNGHWTSWKFDLKRALIERQKRIPSGPWSDSRAMAFFFGIYGPEIMNFEDFGHDQRVLHFHSNGYSRWGSWTEGDGFEHSNPSHGWMGEINIAPEKKESKWERKKREAEERKAAKPGKTETQKLLAAAKAIFLPPHRTQKPEFNDSEFWSTEELKWILVELRQFNFHNFGLARQKAA